MMMWWHSKSSGIAHSRSTRVLGDELEPSEILFQIQQNTNQQAATIFLLGNLIHL
jgi:hypothetical protein